MPRPDKYTVRNIGRVTVRRDDWSNSKRKPGENLEERLLLVDALVVETNRLQPKHLSAPSSPDTFSARQRE